MYKLGGRAGPWPDTGWGGMDDHATAHLSGTSRDDLPERRDHLGSRDAFEDDSSRETISLTVLVPTRNEASNVVRLLDGLSHALEAISAEVVFVDDSDDATP